MKRLLDLFRSDRPASPATPRPSVRPGVESLEDRLALSMSSPSLHAVKPPPGPSGSGSAVFFLGPKDNAFYEKTPRAAVVKLSAPNTVTDFSAGLDSAGHPVVFAHRGGVMAEFDAAGWHTLNQPMRMLHYAAVNGGRCYAEGADHSLWQYSPPFTKTVHVTYRGHSYNVTVHLGGWRELADANTVYGLDAVTQRSDGFDVVFAIGHDLSLQRYDTRDGSWETLIAPGDWLTFTFSAGLTAKGNAAVWTQNADYDLLSIDRDNGSLNYGTLLAEATISATNGGRYLVFNGEATGGLQNVAAISAAAVDHAFAMTTDGHFFEFHDDGTGWHEWL